MTLARRVAVVLSGSILVTTFACVGDDPGAPSSGSVGNDGGSSSGGSSSGSSGDAATCAAPRATCGDVCVDLRSDDAHCGDCATACPGTKCFNGVCDGARVKQVATGAATSCAVRTDGSVYCWGRGQYSALGQPFTGGAGIQCGTERCQPTPMRVPNLDPVDSISVGHHAACALTLKGDVFCWGANRAGELGPIAASQTCEGSATCLQKPTKIAGVPPDVAEVQLSLNHACARTKTGAVWCWGDAAYGRLGRGNFTASDAVAQVTGIPAVAQLALSGDQFGHTCIVAKGTSEIWCWGYNEHYQLGHDKADDPFCPSSSFKCNPTPTKASGTGVASATRIVAGAAHTCAVSQSNDAYCWGYAGYKIGTTTGTNSATARLVAPSVSAISGRLTSLCVLRLDGTVGCLGHSSGARLGFIETKNQNCIDGTTTWPCNDGSPSNVAVNDVAMIDSTAATIALTKDGKILMWGPNDDANLGLAPTAPTAKSCPNYGSATTSSCSDVPVTITLP